MLSQHEQFLYENSFRNAVQDRASASAKTQPKQNNKQSTDHHIPLHEFIEQSQEKVQHSIIYGAQEGPTQQIEQRNSQGDSKVENGLEFLQDKLSRYYRKSRQLMKRASERHSSDLASYNKSNVQEQRKNSLSQKSQKIEFDQNKVDRKVKGKSFGDLKNLTVKENIAKMLSQRQSKKFYEIEFDEDKQHNKANLKNSSNNADNDDSNYHKNKSNSKNTTNQKIQRAHSNGNAKQIQQVNVIDHQTTKEKHHLSQVLAEMQQIENLLKTKQQNKQLQVYRLRKEVEFEQSEKRRVYEINVKLQKELHIIKLEQEKQTQNISGLFQGQKRKINNLDSEKLAQLNLEHDQVQKQFQSAKKALEKVKKRNKDLKEEQKILRESLKMAFETRKQYIRASQYISKGNGVSVTSKPKQTQEHTTSLYLQNQTKIKAPAVSNNQINKDKSLLNQKQTTKKQQKLLYQLADEFQQLKSIVNQRMKNQSRPDKAHQKNKKLKSSSFQNVYHGHSNSISRQKPKSRNLSIRY